MSIKNYIIRRPLLTEKMSRLEETERKYAFEVHQASNKLEIKAAVEAQFGVKVVKVATQNRLGKAKNQSMRSGGHTIRTTGHRANWKKAIVTLADGEKIDLFELEGTA